MRARRPLTLLWDSASWGLAGWTGLDHCLALGGCEQHPGECSWVLGLTVRLLWASWRQGREEVRESPGLLILGGSCLDSAPSRLGSRTQGTSQRGGGRAALLPAPHFSWAGNWVMAGTPCSCPDARDPETCRRRPDPPAAVPTAQAPFRRGRGVSNPGAIPTTPGNVPRGLGSVLVALPLLSALGRFLPKHPALVGFVKKGLPVVSRNQLN